MKKLKKSVLFYTILYAILLYTLYLILEKFNLMFRQWVNIISFIIIGSGLHYRNWTSDIFYK